MIDPNIISLVKFISANIKCIDDKKSKWAKLKSENVGLFAELLGIENEGIKNPGSLIDFDIDEESQLILLNYSGQAHNTLHQYSCGWSSTLRQIRGLVFDVSNPANPVLVSRSFEKFFNLGELAENTYENLLLKYGENNKFVATEKIDGHMIQYFMHNDKLYSTTRGRFKTISGLEAQSYFTAEAFNEVNSFMGNRIMTFAVELVTKSTEVFVDYEGNESIYLLSAYDVDGNKLSYSDLNVIYDSFPQYFKKPNRKMFTLVEALKEKNDRSVLNNEGWVIDLNGELIKLKYISYIGMMVKSKLSFKYLMSCMINDRLEKMINTLPEETRTISDEMLKVLIQKRKESLEQNDHKVLYSLYNDYDFVSNI